MSGPTQTGSCLCGNVRITLSAAPVAVALCHCRDCQKQSGSAFSLVAIVPLSALDVSGDTAVWRTVADSGQTVERTFCRTCGSPVRTDSEGARGRGITVLKASLMDEAASFIPQVQIYCGSAAPWVEDLKPLARFDGMPP
jgi:hypothetical protein